MSNVVIQVFAWLHARHPAVKAATQAALAIILFIIGAALEDRVQLVFDNEPKQVIRGIFWVVCLFGSAAIYGVLHYAYLWGRQQEEDLRTAQRRAIQNARERLVGLHLAQLADCDSIIETKPSVSLDAFRSILICDRSRLDELVKTIWEVVDAHHNVSTNETERVNFEVTLFTPSRVDSNLTIAAWRNKDMRRPKSLRKKENGEPDIYKKTEAAKLINLGASATKVISDTAKPQANYEQLYDDQKARIQSSVLHPIVSPASKPLGVLVLHCEVAKFFKEADQRYWSELFSVFAPAVALELERIDAYNRAVRAWREPISFPQYKPF